MVHVLMPLMKPGLPNMPANLVAYADRGQARPAYQAALAAQLADFTEEAPQPVSA